MGAGRAQFSVAVSPESCGSAADRLFQRFPQARPFHSGIPHCGDPRAGLSVAALKVRLTLHAGAASSAEGVARSPKDPPTPRRATGLHGPRPPGAARRKLSAALRAAPGTRPRCSRAAPPRAALPAAGGSEASEHRPGRRAGGAAATLLAPTPPPGRAGLRRRGSLHANSHLRTERRGAGLRGRVVITGVEEEP